MRQKRWDPSFGFWSLCSQHKITETTHLVRWDSQRNDVCLNSSWCSNSIINEVFSVSPVLLISPQSLKCLSILSDHCDLWPFVHSHSVQADRSLFLVSQFQNWPRVNCSLCACSAPVLTAMLSHYLPYSLLNVKSAIC